MRALGQQPRGRQGRRYPTPVRGENPAPSTVSRNRNFTRSRLFKPDTALGYRHELIGEPECPYLERWVLNTGPFALRLHHWMGSDDQRHLHDHPWWFITLGLKGGYEDLIECPACHGKGQRPRYSAATTLGVRPGLSWNWCGFCQATGKIVGDRMAPGRVRVRAAVHRHIVRVYPGGAWTLLITGRKERDWGFWVDGSWKRMRRYFKDHGHHPCED